MKDYNKELLNNIPDSYDSMTLNQYLLIVDNKDISTDASEVENINTTVELISNLSGISTGYLKNIPFNELTPFLSRITFLGDTPKGTKTKYKLKDIDSISYNDYISYYNLSKDVIHNIKEILQLFIKDVTTIDEIGNISVNDAFYILDILKKKSQHLTIVSLRRMTIRRVIIIIKYLYYRMILLFKRKPLKIK